MGHGHCAYDVMTDLPKHAAAWGLRDKPRRMAGAPLRVGDQYYIIIPTSSMRASGRIRANSGAND